MFWLRINTSNTVSLRRNLLRTSLNVSRSRKLQTLIPKACNNVKQNNLLLNELSTSSRRPGTFSSNSSTEEVDHATFESVCSETLDSLCEFFEDIIESKPIFKTADVSFGDGVLTVNLDTYGTYVINRQSPNKQIWLSSPLSGPKRYDYLPSRNGWVYRHDNKTLHGLLKDELSSIVKSSIDLSSCAYCGDLK